MALEVSEKLLWDSLVSGHDFTGCSKTRFAKVCIRARLQACRSSATRHRALALRKRFSHAEIRQATFRMPCAGVAREEAGGRPVVFAEGAWLSGHRDSLHRDLQAAFVQSSRYCTE